MCAMSGLAASVPGGSGLAFDTRCGRCGFRGMLGLVTGRLYRPPGAGAAVTGTGNAFCGTFAAIGTGPNYAMVHCTVDGSLLNEKSREFINSGANSGQEVPHYHVHILGGRGLGPMLVTP